MSASQSNRHRVRWTPDMVEKALDLVRREGAPNAAQALGVSYSSLAFALRYRGHSIKRSESQGEMIARLYAARWPAADIAARAGVTVKTVYTHAYALRKRGVPVPRAVCTAGYERVINYAVAAEMGRAGVPRAEIAARFGVTKSAIGQAFARMRAEGIDCGPAGRWPRRDA
jgi:transposase